MERRSVEAIVRALNRAGVRYLVAGGLAVVAHGYVRYTADVDLFIDLDEGNLLRALRILARLGYRPRAPVTMEAFADPVQRRRWIREKGMRVFSLISSRHALTEVDVFARPPLEFRRAWGRAARRDIVSKLRAPILGLEDLVRIKRKAGRPQDLADVEKLTRLKEARRGR